MAESGDRFAQLIDFTRVAVIGHSLGGLAAAQACGVDATFVACANLDGIQEGGIFAVRERSLGPAQPFLFLTKETTLTPALVSLLEDRPASTAVVMISDAAHDSFTDGPVLTPSVLPGTNAADRALERIRSVVRTFLEQAFAGGPIAIPEATGVAVRMFPLRS
jgi:pimeloyl-ACP methyl ester carboxylesterase